VVAHSTILEESLRIFDRTFTITEVLQWLAGIIAFISVFSALMGIQLERARELGILKAIGITPRQIRGIVLGETALLGGTAGLLAVPVGLIMGWLLVFVVNRRSFGWTMALELDPAVILGGLLTALVAALLAGLYPSARMARAQPAVVLRQE
jgi:putative ABC transport system permease protein